MSMERLKEIEKNNGCIYNLLERDGNWVLYSQAYTTYPNTIIGYEIFKVRKGAAGNERFPRTSDWGSEAFTCYRNPQSIQTYLAAKHE